MKKEVNAVKALSVMQVGKRPAEAIGWFPPPNSYGIATFVKVPEANFKRVVVLWRDDPNEELRMIDIWGSEIRVIGELISGVPDYLRQKIETLKKQLMAPAECGE